MSDEYYAAWLIQRDECARLSRQVKALTDELDTTKEALRIASGGRAGEPKLDPALNRTIFFKVKEK